MYLYVKLRDGETFESLLKRFRVGVERQGILRDFRRHQAFMSKSQKARLKARKAERKRLTKSARKAA